MVLLLVLMEPIVELYSDGNGFGSIYQNDFKNNPREWRVNPVSYPVLEIYIP